MSAGQGPLHQFEIAPLAEFSLAGYDLHYTNSALFMTLAVFATVAFLSLSMRGRALVPGRWQSMAELAYGFIASTVKDNCGSAGKPYFPFIFTLFMFVIMCNLLGMVPYSFTVTSHIAVTFALAIFIFFAVTLVSIFKHGLGHFLAHFLPEGTPWWMAPLMYFIELFSYLARPVSLSVRLAANMMAGHTMLKVIAGFATMMGAAAVVPLIFLVALTGFEIFVAVLQAYIFTVLTCVYLNEALHSH